ncbi:MAG: DUF2948 family protein [Pseudomonadota bacterium]
MTEDARFEDGALRPLRLRAIDEDDVRVIATLVQDAVFPATEMRWDRTRRRFALLLNRFRWEEVSDQGAPERVQTVLAIDDALAVRSQGIDRRDPDLVLSILSVSWRAGEDGAGWLTLMLAGDGAIEVAVEALELTLRDVTRPYVAPSGQRPSHPE